MISFHTLARALSTLAAAAALASAAGVACAASVSYAFTVSGGAGAGHGSFQFDDAAGSTNGFGETEFDLTAFSFTLGGNTYDLGDLEASLHVAIFDGSVFRGLEASEVGGAFAFVPALGQLGPFVALGRTTSDLQLDPAGELPEPASWALALAAVGALAGGRLRARRRSAHAVRASSTVDR